MCSGRRWPGCSVQSGRRLFCPGHVSVPLSRTTRICKPVRRSDPLARASAEPELVSARFGLVVGGMRVLNSRNFIGDETEEE